MTEQRNGLTARPEDIKMVPVTKIKPAEYNPRKDLVPKDKAYQKIAASIKEFGLVSFFVINKDGTLISGHQRFKIMCDMGYTQVPCLILDISKEREKTLNVAMNQISGEWDMQKLADLLEEIQGADIDTLLTGFDYDSMDRILNKYGWFAEMDTEAEDIDIDPFLRSDYVPIAQSGDIWYIGPHTVICGDARDSDAYRKLMKGRRAQMILTDPPYGTNTSKTGGKMQNDDLKGTEYQGFIAESLKCMKPHLEDKGVIYLFYADANTVEVRTAMRDTGWHISSGCIWVKNCPVSGYGNYNYAHECVLYAWKEGSTHEWYALSQGSTVWNCDRPHSTLFHSVSKPLALLEIPIRNSSIRGQIVLDPFLGTGSTLIICDQLERVCCGIE